MEPAEPLPDRTAVSCLPSISLFTSWFTSWFINSTTMDSLERAPKSTEEPEAACVFTYEQLKKATNQFHREIGSGGYGSVFRGELRGKGTVAVKVLKQRSKKSIEQFNNEVEILSRLRHPNLVAFYGSTKPSEELLLVYEFVPNRTVAFFLHDVIVPLSWSLRMRIAIETAEGLSYLHSRDPPIIHRDIKTENMLVDEQFHVKIADFGLCRLLPLDGTNISTITPGTWGYQDPEYDRSFKVTDKNDVYSFGVVLLELITRQKAVDVYRGLDRVYLDAICVDMIKNGEFWEFVDPAIRYSHRNAKEIIDMVADLAYKCLQPKGDQRPPMSEVLRVLKDIRVFGEITEPTGKEIFDAIMIPCEGREENVGPVDFDSAQIFSYEELEEATDTFNPSRLLDKGGSCRTYRGMLRNGLTVAVKEVFDVKLSRLGQLFNKVTMLYHFGHKNLVTVYGCTFPRNEKMLLVCDFVPNGNLADHLHGDQTGLTWAVRMQVAIQTAKALAYLHALDPQVIHCDVKSSNILLDNTYYWLDNTFNVKVAGFTMRHILPCGTTRVLSLPPGTVGYQDPEYRHTLTLSNKSDVYSFGVVLAELISGQKAVDVNREFDQIYLDRMFLNMITNNKLDEFVDPRLEYHLDNNVKMMIVSISELACQCLQPKADNRPSIAEVLNVLEGIAKPKVGGAEEVGGC